LQLGSTVFREAECLGSRSLRGKEVVAMQTPFGHMEGVCPWLQPKQGRLPWNFKKTYLHLISEHKSILTFPFSSPASLAPKRRVKGTQQVIWNKRTRKGTDSSETWLLRTYS
jgi:hypothetical protein